MNRFMAMYAQVLMSVIESTSTAALAYALSAEMPSRAS
jgi:hypothetical protein